MSKKYREKSLFGFNFLFLCDNIVDKTELWYGIVFFKQNIPLSRHTPYIYRIIE